MSKVMKAMAVILLAVMIVASICTVVNATGDENEFSFSSVGTNTVTDKAKDTSGAAASINRIVGAVLTIVQGVGCGVAVIMLIVLAIKYISAAPGDKADIKIHAFVLVVGAVVLFAARGILGIVKKFAGNIN